MTYKPVDTAIVMVVGPCIDNTDFKTLEEAIAYDAAGMDVSLIVEKTDGTSAVTAITLTTGGTSDWTHKDGGYYEIEVTAAQNVEEGIAYIRGICTGVLPFESIHYNVVKANVYDSWIKGTDVLQTDVTQWLGTAAATPTVAGVPEVDVTHMAGGVQTVTDLKDFADAGYDPATNKVQGVVLVDTTTTNTDLVSAADVVNEWETQSQADPTGFHVNVLEIGGTAQTANDNGADINAILIDTAEIGAAGVGLTAVPWNASWDTEVESECNDALVALKLDHLIAVADADDVVDNSVIAKLASLGATADWSTYVNTTDSLQAIRDRGDAAWTTGAGGSDRLLMVDTTIATLASQTGFTLTAGSADDDAYNNCTIVIEDVSTATQKAVGIISAYTGATKTVTLKYDPAIFTMATTDKVYILAENALKATLANRQLNVAADGDVAGNVDGSVASVVGHTAQTGDSFARIGATGSSLTSLAPASTALTDVTWTDAKAVFLNHSIATVDTNVDTLLTRVTAAVALASVCTEGRLAELDAANIPTDLTHLLTRLTIARAAYLDQLPNIVADTDELQTDWTNGGRLDLILDIIAEDTTTDIPATISTMQGNVTDILADTGTDGVLLAATATSAQLVDDTWDEILSGATHNIVGSAGRRVREIGAYAIESGTAQAGTSQSITLAATASAIDGTYNRNLVVLTDNTGVGQTRTIVDYNGSTKIAVIDRDWRTAPDATTTYQVTADNTPLVVDQGVAQAGTSTTVTLRTYASSSNDIYLCNVVAIIAGTGRGQARLIGAYNGTTKVATICGDNWITNPDNTSVYVLMPYGTTCTSCIGTYALGLINTECDTALTDYDPPTRTEATADKDAIITEVDANETKIDALQTDSTAIKAKTDNLPDGIKKNTAITAFTFLMVDSTDHVTAKTGLTVAGNYSGDGGAVAALTNTGAITEISNGLYEIDLTSGELNYENVTLIFTASGADARVITIHTST